MSPSDRQGFVDLLVDNPVSGRMYLCATCLDQAARVMGCLDPEQAQRLRNNLGAAEEKIKELEAEVEFEKANKVMSEQQMKHWFRDKELKRSPGAGGRPPKPLEDLGDAA